MNSTTLLWIIVTLLFSAFFSGMEIAFISANRLRIELKNKQGNVIARILSSYLKEPYRFISTTLVGSNIVLVIYGVFMGVVLEDAIRGIFPVEFQSEAFILVINTIVSTFIVLIFGEYLPKALFRNYADNWLFTFIIPFRVLQFILYPFSKLLELISSVFIRIFIKNFKNENVYNVFTKEDLGHFVAETAAKSKNEEVADVDTEMFRNALDFDKVKARDCMVPRTEIQAIELMEPVEELYEKFRETGLSRILVYQDSIDHIIGYVHQVDMFKNPKEITHILISLVIAAPSTPVNELLKKFKTTRKSVALIVDEFGGTAGIVTMEDVLEEIIGEIDDEHDVEELTESRIDELTFEFSARLETEYLNEAYQLRIPAGDYDTLGGYIISLTGSIPSVGEEITTDRLEMVILKMQGARIDKVKIHINPEG